MSGNGAVIAAVVACDRNGVIGSNNEMPWGKLKRDLAHFVRLTKGHPLIMGRKTFESIGSAPLPNRANIVVTRQPHRLQELERQYSNLRASPSLSNAFDLARNLDENQIFVIGGGEIYKQALPSIDAIYMTLIDRSYEGDTFFPEIDSANWEEIARRKETDEGGVGLEFIDWARKSPDSRAKCARRAAPQFARH